jgi:hypothetical protein
MHVRVHARVDIGEHCWRTNKERAGSQFSKCPLLFPTVKVYVCIFIQNSGARDLSLLSKAFTMQHQTCACLVHTSTNKSIVTFILLRISMTYGICMSA